MRSPTYALLFVLVASPVNAAAQGIAEVMGAIRDGGGWVGIAIEDGRGSARSTALPTAGLSVAGCVNVWYGHSGEFEIRAVDRVTQEVLEIRAEPGVGVPFSHTFGVRAQVDFDFQWSEPRDTTLMLWVGMGLGRQGGSEACEPKYGGG